jgi:hypothetical protein
MVRVPAGKELGLCIDKRDKSQESIVDAVVEVSSGEKLQSGGVSNAITIGITFHCPCQPLSLLAMV